MLISLPILFFYQVPLSMGSCHLISQEAVRDIVDA